MIVFSLLDGTKGSMSLVFAVLDPTIQIFIYVAAIAGPLSIAVLIFLLKKIEKNDPERIRWR